MEEFRELTRRLLHGGLARQRGGSRHTSRCLCPIVTTKIVALFAALLVSVPAHAIPPNANAGPNQNVNEQTGVALDGTASNDNGDGGFIVSFSWSQIQGTNVNLVGANTATPSFTAPVRTVQQGAETLIFQLTVVDNGAEFDTDTVSIVVNPVNANPVANAGANQNVNEQSPVGLNGTSSSDSDGSVVSFAWSQIGGTTVSLSGSNTATPSFTSPSVSAGSPDVLTFSLLVTDNENGTNTDTVSITVSGVNADPVANAGPDQSVNESAFVTLNGTGSNDPDGTIATFAWSQTGGPGVTLNGAGTASPSFTAPDLPGNQPPQTLTFSLLVTDNEGATDTDTVDVVVNQVNVPPVIQSQFPISTQEDTAVEITLTDLTVTDPDNNYPADFTLATQNGANYSRSGNVITPANDFVGTLTVPVTVNDGQDPSPVFNVTISVTAVNDVPEITGQQSLSIQEDPVVGLTVQIADLIIDDPDNSPNEMTLSLSDGQNYTRVGNTVTPVANYNGNLTVITTVSDGQSTSANFSLQITVDAVNDQPFVSAPIGGQNAVENSPFSLDVSGNFDDVDNDPLDYSVMGLPPSGNITFDQQNGLFSGTPLFEDTEPAVYDVTVIASDVADTSTSDTFQLTVAALDRANVSLGITVSPSPAMANDQLQWTFTAMNPAGPQAAGELNLDGSFFGNGLTISSSDNCVFDAPVGQVNNFSCLMGGLPVGGSSSIVINTLTSDSGDVTTFAVTQGVNPIPIDPNLDDNDGQTAVGVAETFSNGAVQILGSSSITAIAAGDLNGDGATDLVVGTSAGQPVQVFINDGFRRFTPSAGAPTDIALHSGVALADFDSNGTLDIVLANGGGQPDQVFANDGAGVFTVMATLGSTFAEAVAVGDFDNDQNADIAFATVEGNPVYLGDGAGGFTLHDTLGTANSLDVAVGRFNDDSRDDLVFANVGGGSVVWTKRAAAGFAQSSVLAIGDATSVASADLGGDETDDLVFGRMASDVGDIPANPVLINDGSGQFANPVAELGNSPTNDVHIGDVDRDGVADLVFINASGVHQIWTAAAGSYMLHIEQIFADGAVAGVLTDLGFADIDEPGGIDLAMGGTIQTGAGVFLNDGFGNLGKGDAVPPVLTLLGEATLDVPSNTIFVDPGATADDNIDGNISNSIVVDNPVQTSVVGTYVMTYNVSDDAGNLADSISRTVNVTPSAGSGGSGGGGALGFWSILLLAWLGVLRQIDLAIRLAARPQNLSRGIYK